MDKPGTELTVRRMDYAREYLRKTSIALSLVRSIECNVLSGMKFVRPVLDIGCGDGLFAGMLFEDKVDNGIDISPKEIERARRSGKYGQLEVARAGSLPFPDNSFMTVFSNCVVEHLDDLDASFAEACRVTAPGGKFYCTTHSDHYEEYFLWSTVLRRLGFEKLARKYSGFWAKLWSHYNCLSEEDWTSRLRKAGFSDVKVVPYFNKEAVWAFDLMLPLASLTYLTRKITGNWKLFPRTITLLPALWLVNRIARNFRTGDWCYLLIATK